MALLTASLLRRLPLALLPLLPLLWLLLPLPLVLLVLFGEVGLYRRRGLEGLSYRCHFSETERTEGESLRFVETVTNDKTLPVPWLKAELTTSRWLDFPEANSAVTGENRFVSSFFSVRSRSRVSRVWEITCEKRGVYEMEHIVLVTSDLLGIVRLSLHAADHGGKLTVLPKRLTEAGLLLPKLLRQQYGDGALEMVRRNPYLLSDDVCGVDFSVTDTMALSMGFAEDCGQRLEAAVTFELTYNENNGHVFLPKDKLLSATCQLLGCGAEQVETALDALAERHAVVIQRIANVEAVYLRRLWEAETSACARLLALLEVDADQSHFADKAVAEIEREQGITYAPLQRQAVELAAKTGVILLTGGPGTGKTTTVRGIVTLFQKMGLNIVLAAPTGRAAKRMAEITGREASTIHRLLEVEPKTEVLTFKRGEKNPLPADAVIVDEMSMVDTLLMEHLLRGMRLGARLIMVGDSDQLPSVSAGNVLRDLIQSGLVPCIHLERVFRQAAESLIVTNAHAIVRGEMPDLGCRTGDFFFLEQPDAFAQQRLVVDLVSRRLPKSYGYDPLRDIQVITPAKQGPLGTRELNRLLQGKLNPPERGKGEATLMGRTLREGDKVMQIRNNYDIIWQQPDGTAGTGIFNGDMGIIEMLDPGSKTIQVRFEEKLATYSFENQDQLEHAYAVTVHKSQGSEFEAVVMPLERRHPKLHYRNLLYTAVTRARKLLIMTGQKETVYAMVQNNRRTLRYTNQKEMLQEMCDE